MRFTLLQMLNNLLLLAVSSYILIALSLYFFQTQYIYHPTSEFYATPEQRGMPFEGVLFPTEDGLNLHGWFIPAPQAQATLLFFHGNAGNISHRLESLAIFHELGLNIFIFDYRGYGYSEGKPSEEGTYQDALAAWRYLTESRHLSPEQIIMFGRSLGGAIAAWLAARRQPRGIILESAFTSVPDLAGEIFPFLPTRLLSRFQYNTRAEIARLHCPVLLIHSPDDDIIPYHHSQTLLQAAPDPKFFLQIKGGHNGGFLESRGIYIEGLEIFLHKILKI